MTANQLQYHANTINQQLADETGRHNKAYEDETNRHNVITEDLAARELDLKEKQESEVERHNQQMELIQQEYNRLYLELQKAQGDERNRIQAEIANVEQQKALEVTRHNQEMEVLSSDSNWIQAQHEEEVNRHNQALELLETDLNAIRKEQNRITEQMNNYQNVFWTGQLADMHTRNSLELMKIQNQFTLGSYNTMIDLYKTQNAFRQTAIEAELANTQKFNQLTSGILNLTKGVTNVVVPYKTLGNLW